MLFDKAIYKGKEYVCRKITSKRIEIRSYEQTDADLHFLKNSGYWCKCVYISECESYDKYWGCASYKGKRIEICEVDRESKEILVFVSDSYGYSEDFVKTVLNGKEGRDIFSKCKAEMFDKFWVVNRDSREENEISLEKLEETTALYNPGVLIWDLAEDGGFISASLI